MNLGFKITQEFHFWSSMELKNSRLLISLNRGLKRPIQALSVSKVN